MCWHTLCLCKDSKAAAISKMAEILLGSRMMDPFWCTWYIKVLKDPATRTCWGISMSRIIQVLEPKHGNHCCHLLVSRLVHSGPKKELPWMANWIKIKKHCMGVDSTHCIYLHCVHACMYGPHFVSLECNYPWFGFHVPFSQAALRLKDLISTEKVKVRDASLGHRRSYITNDTCAWYPVYRWKCILVDSIYNIWTKCLISLGVHPVWLPTACRSQWPKIWFPYDLLFYNMHACLF
jgi:hypothetical protein